MIALSLFPGDNSMSRSTRHRRQPRIECLEVRELLSADASAHTHVAHSVMNVRPTDNGDPDFIPVRGLAAEQMSAAIDIFRVEHLVLIWYSAHHRSSADAGRHLALGHDAIMGSTRDPFEAFEKIFGKEESPAIESFCDAVGPANPFAGLPSLTEARLNPGDIIATTGPVRFRRRCESPLGLDSAMSHLYVGNGMIEDSTGRGVVVRPLADLLASTPIDGVLRDTAVGDTQLEAVVTDALKLQNKPYNYGGVSAIAARKAAGVSKAAQRGLNAIIGVLSRARLYRTP